MKEKKATTAEYSVDGEMLVTKIRELLHEGNIRRITIKNEQGQSLIEIPLTLGLVGAALLPVFAAIGAAAALVAKCTIVVEKQVEDKVAEVKRPAPRRRAPKRPPA